MTNPKKRTELLMIALFFLFTSMVMGCSETPAPFQIYIDTDGAGELLELDTDTDMDGAGELELDTDTDGAGELLELDTDTDTDGAGELELDTDTDGADELELDTDTHGADELELDTDTDGAGELELDTDTDGAGELELDTDTDGAGELELDTDCDLICPKMIFTFPDMGSYLTECVSCFSHDYGWTKTVCGVDVWYTSDSTIERQMDEENCNYILCCEG